MPTKTTPFAPPKKGQILGIPCATSQYPAKYAIFAYFCPFSILFYYNFLQNNNNIILK